MMGNDRDEIPCEEIEGEPESLVLPMPYVIEERALRGDLERLDGTWTEGPVLVITIPRPGGGHVYLCGTKTLFSNFVERAYVMDEENARRIVLEYPTLLEGAKILVRDR